MTVTNQKLIYLIEITTLFTSKEKKKLLSSISKMSENTKTKVIEEIINYEKATSESFSKYQANIKIHGNKYREALKNNQDLALDERKFQTDLSYQIEKELVGLAKEYFQTITK